MDNLDLQHIACKLHKKINILCNGIKEIYLPFALFGMLAFIRKNTKIKWQYTELVRN